MIESPQLAIRAMLAVAANLRHSDADDNFVCFIRPYHVNGALQAIRQYIDRISCQM
jgi:hypothetical protein